MNDRLSELYRQQREFAAHIRDPEQFPAPAHIDDRRMGVYRELFFNNVRRFLGNYFPVLLSIIGEERWATLVRDFYRDHASSTPLFTELAAEFLVYLETEHQNAADYPPFMAELAHYEWVESALNLAADPDIDADPDGDPLEGVPVLSPLAWPLAYHWVVNEINADNQPETPAESPVHFLIYRNGEDKVVFNRINAVSARLLQLLSEETGITGRAALEQIAVEMQRDDAGPVIEAGAVMLRDWHQKGIILGTGVTR